MVAGIVVPSAAPSRAPTWFEQRSCRCKARFDTHSEARLAAKAVMRREGGTLRAYHCRFCNGWHVGHPMARRRR